MTSGRRAPRAGMADVAQTLASLILAALVMRCVAGALLRLAAISCFVCAAGLLAIGDHTSATGVAMCGAVCRTARQLLHRTRRR